MSILCPHFGDCGGCQSQDVPYAEQLERKEAQLRDLFAAFWDGPIPVEPSPLIWHYRNKVDPSFGLKRYDDPPPEGFEREILLGFKRKGRWFWPLNIDECLIGPEGMGGLLEAVRAWQRRHGLTAFDSQWAGEGFLRTLLIREAKRTGERMVVLITSPGEFDRASFVEAVRSAGPATSIYRGIFRGLADVAFAEEMELLDGVPAIIEELHIPDGEGIRKLYFRVSPFSFLQTNSLGAERLYGLVREWARETAPAVLYDLYGGAGGMAFACSDLVEQVWSVEIVEDATRDGITNAAANGIGNVTFVNAKVKNYLRELILGSGMPPDSAAIVDPPRAGLHPKALRRLVELAPRDVLYISCNPKMLAQEMPQLLEVYRLESLRAVDLFPHTRHVEVLARFTLPAF